MNDIWFSFPVSSHLFEPISKHFRDLWRTFAIIYWTDFLQIATQEEDIVKEYFRREGA